MFSLYENRLSASDILCHERMFCFDFFNFLNVHSFFCLFFLLSESVISKVQSPPTRTSRRNQSKAKSRPPEPEVDLQLLKTLCTENECNAEEV